MRLYLTAAVIVKLKRNNNYIINDCNYIQK